MDSTAERYVKLVLSLGEHDPDYVDAYYGFPEWREEVHATKPSLEHIHAAALALHEELVATPRPADHLLELRILYLIRQTESLIARAEILNGRRMSFDEESKALYDAVAPHNAESHFQLINAQLERELPGRGPLIDRLESFRREFIIPRDHLDAVFSAAIAACRAITLEHMKLPPNEAFTVEYVNDKSWSGYNWYQGNFRSLIQVNTDLPIFIDRAIDLACHEGYPGHHVYNALLEQNLVRRRGWSEFSVYALFSPQSLIAEGSANYGIDVAFPSDARVEFEREALFPVAGLDGGRAHQYYRVHELTQKATYAGNEAARRYLDGEINADGAVEWLMTYALMAPARARQRVRFFDQYRSYVINYNLGKDLVKRHVEKLAGPDEDRRWRVFMELLSSPMLPSSLAA
ncbi:MAG TPA: hypothetical protein VLV78_11390 [Thermoanaerobaculia bacterium]|nr:hypothetical protein [Thermoanaerobaculia bacterium]